MDYAVTFAAQAQRDLFAIVRFLAEKNPAAARKLGDSLLEAALSLAHFPDRGVAVRARAGLRRLAHPPHHLIFLSRRSGRTAGRSRAVLGRPAGSAAVEAAVARSAPALRRVALFAQRCAVWAFWGGIAVLVLDAVVTYFFTTLPGWCRSSSMPSLSGSSSSASMPPASTAPAAPPARRG